MVRRASIVGLFLTLLSFGGILVGLFPPALQAQELTNRLFLPYINLLDDGDNDGTFFSHYDPVFVLDVNNRVYIDETPPPERTVIYAGGTDDLARNIANWAVGDFTGYYPTNPLRQTQRGVPSGTYDTSAVQMEGFVAGMHLRARQGETEHSAQYAQLYYGFRATPLPWARGVNPRFCMDQEVALPRSEWGQDAINFANGQLAFVDATTGKRIWVVMSLYDSRPTLFDRGDIISWWDEAQEPIVYALFGGDRYTSLMIDSERSASQPWTDWRYFGFCISGDQMRSIVRDANQQFGLTMSEDITQYGVGSFGVGPEMYNPTRGDGLVSMRVREVRLFTLADPQ